MFRKISLHFRHWHDFAKDRLFGHALTPADVEHYEVEP